MFDIFVLLSMLPAYNPILMSTINMLLNYKINLHVAHIPGSENIVVATLSHYNNDFMTRLMSSLQMGTFQPPQDVLRAAKK